MAGLAWQSHAALLAPVPIAVAARDEKKGEAAIKELNSSGVRCRFYSFHASSASSCQKLVEGVVSDFSCCDILVNNAGTNVRKVPEEISEGEWHEIIDVNLGAALFCAQAAYPHMKTAGRGKVLNIGSMYSRFGAPTTAGRWGEPYDIAGAAVFLCSPAADFVTGAALPVDGGYSARG